MIEGLFEYLFSVERPQAAFWMLVGIAIYAMARQLDF